MGRMPIIGLALTELTGQSLLHLLRNKPVALAQRFNNAVSHGGGLHHSAELVEIQPVVLLAGGSICQVLPQTSATQQPATPAPFQEANHSIWAALPRRENL